MRKRGLWCAVLLAMALTLGGVAEATSVFLYVDAAPNVYGSPDYQPWLDATYGAITTGNFTNMILSYNPGNIGTTNFEIQDEVVYSFGDLGSRLTWIYWIPNETIENLGGNDLFEIRLENTWDGDYQDFYLDYYGSSWLEPTKWQNYTDGNGNVLGVIGTAGMAYWGAYGINTQEALDADIAAWAQATETWTFTARLYNQAGDFEDYSITSYRAPVPEPATFLIVSLGLSGIAITRRRKV